MSYLSRFNHTVTRRRLAYFLVAAAALFVSVWGISLRPGETTLAQSSQVGYADFNYGATVVSAPTGEKPESKLWWNDGLWWGDLFSPAANSYHIYRLNLSTQTWVDTGTAIDDRPSTKGDALWDTATQKLYVVSHGGQGFLRAAVGRLHGKQECHDQPQPG
jgi:hypothetical protein